MYSPTAYLLRHRRARKTRKVLGAVILGAEFPDVPDLDGDPSDPPADPLDGDGAKGAAADAGAAATENIPTSLPGSGAEIPQPVTEAIQTAAPDAIDAAVASVPTAPDGVMGQTIQATVTDQIKADPQGFHDSALSRVLESPDVGGDITKATPADVEAAYNAEAQARVETVTQDLKTYYGDGVKGAVTEITGGDADFDTEKPYKDGKSLTDSAIDDPDGTEAQLQADGDAIEKENPDWKDRVKEAAGYGAKGLLILAVIGAFLPGGSNVIDKLASMAGDIVAKLVTAAANILKAFFGPLLKTFWDFIKKLKGPLIVIGIIVAILIVLWVYRQIRGSK